jgi:hypothetical protein
MQDERYARYLEQPGALREAAAAADGERVLEEVLDEEQRDGLVRSVAAPMQADEGSRAGCRWLGRLPWPPSVSACASSRRRSPGSAPGRMTISTRRC